jgi:hypothetical protein
MLQIRLLNNFYPENIFKSCCSCKNKPTALIPAVVEPSELFRLKCTSYRYTADTNSMHFKPNNPLVVESPPNATTVQQDQSRFISHEGEFTITYSSPTFNYRILNIITNRFKLRSTYTNIV